MKPNNPGLTHVVAAFGYSMKGLSAAFKNERAFRLELIAGIFMVPAAVWLGQSAVEYALLFGSLMLVLIIELINSALEAVVDRVGSDFHELSGRAKDIGSAAVFVALVNVLIIWGALLAQRFELL